MRKLLLLIFVSICSFGQNLELVESREMFRGAVALSNNLLNSLFVSDELKNEVFQLDIDLNVVGSIGGFGSGSENFDSPLDICNNALSLYITDKNNNRIQVFDKDLNFLYTFGLANEQTEEKIYYPISCAVSSSGDFYVLDSENNRIVKFNSNGKYLLQFGDYASGKFQIENPLKLLTNGTDKIFVVQKKKITIFDFYGSGISTLNFDFEITSAYYFYNSLVINSMSKISIISLENVTKSSEFDLSKDFMIEDLKQSIIINRFLFALTSNKIYKFLIAK